MKVIERNLKNDIVGSNGKIFYVEWYKKNGELRKALARLGVKKGLNGNGRCWSDADNQITAYEMTTDKRIVITTDKVVAYRCGKNIVELL